MVETGPDNRGQLLLVGAVVIAVSLLGLALVLNSTIYTQNTNPGATIEEMREVNQQLEVVRTDVTRIGERLTQRDGYVDIHELNATLAFYAEKKAEQIVNRRPAYLTVEFNESASDSERAALRQAEHSPIVSKTNDRNWTLVTDTEFNDSTPFEVTVEPQSTSRSTTFVVEGDDGDRWRLSITEDPSDAVEVDVTYANGTTDSTSVSGSSARVNVTGGTVNGTQRFAFAPGVDAPYDLRVENGHRAIGTYIIGVDESSNVETGNFHTEPRDGQPYVSQEVTTAVIQFQYVSDEMSAESRIRVQLGESDE